MHNIKPHSFSAILANPMAWYLTFISKWKSVAIIQNKKLQYFRCVLFFFALNTSLCCEYLAQQQIKYKFDTSYNRNCAIKSCRHLKNKNEMNFYLHKKLLIFSDRLFSFFLWFSLVSEFPSLVPISAESISSDIWLSVWCWCWRFFFSVTVSRFIHRNVLMLSHCHFNFQNVNCKRRSLPICVCVCIKLHVIWTSHVERGKKRWTRGGYENREGTTTAEKKLVKLPIIIGRIRICCLTQM